MKIALVCDDLTQHGGHENVVLDFCEAFPEAPLYTTLATDEWKALCAEKGIILRTSFMQKFPFKLKLNRFFVPFLFHVLALESFNFDEYDLVISLSSRFAHGILTKPGTRHVCYMSTVGRMFWEPEKYFENDTFSGYKLLNVLKNTFLKLPLSYLRIWDRNASARVDRFFCNSETTKKRIKKYYGKEAEIIYPTINVSDFTVETDKIPEKFYLILTRLVSWKCIDIAIEACRNLDLALKIVGNGPDVQRLRTLAGDNQKIEFLENVSDINKVKYFQNCTALINTQYEDFGIVPLEAMASGRPVIAFKKGGALETVVAGVTGEFFDEQTATSLEVVLKNFDSEKYRKDDCVARARLFDKGIFLTEIKKLVNAV